MLRESSCPRNKHRLPLLPILALLLFSAQAQQASADSNAFVSLSVYEGGSAFDSSTTGTPANATLSGVTGNARSLLSAGAVGVGIELTPGSPYGFYDASARWNDTWTGSGAIGTGVPVAAAMLLHGSITTSALAFSDDFWEITFRYSIGSNDLLFFNASADSSSAEIRAYSNGVEIPVDLVVNATNPLLTDFSVAYTPIVTLSSAGFSESMEGLARVNGIGPLTLDAFNTFQVDLTSLDPSVTFSGEGGRTMPSVPEPGTSALLLAGLGLLGYASRRSE